MTAISIDSIPLVEIRTWEDVCTRPKYQPKIDPSKVALEQIIGKYKLKSQRCGIKSCNRSHGMGYLVACSGGIETNIGHDCGFKYFDVKFKELETRFNRAQKAKKQRAALSSFKAELWEWERKIGFLANGEKQGLWCIAALHYEATKAHNPPVLAALASRAKRVDGELYREEALDAEELEAAREAGSGDRYRRVFVGRINGIGAIASYKTLKNLLENHLMPKIQIFRKLDLDSLSAKELATWNRWVKALDERVNEVRDIITDCNRYMARSNLDTVIGHRHLL